MRTLSLALWTGATLAAAAVGAAPADAQLPEEARWLPWLGCWEAEEDAALESPALRRVFGHVLCVRPAPGGDALEVARIASDRIVSSTLLRADGERSPLEEGGCAGWQSATWSADNERLYLSSELQCEGGTTRSLQAVAAMLPGGVRLDVELLRHDGESTLGVRRSAPVPEAEIAPPGWSAVQEELALAVETARRAAARPLSTNDVIEAARLLPAEVLEVALAERGEGFRLDAAELRRLARAGVPGRVTDLMIALSYPERFTVQPGPVTTIASRAPAAGDRGDPLRPRRGPASTYGGFGWGYYDPYLYGNGYPYGYGYGYRGGYGWRGVGPGPVVVISERRPDAGGRMLKGVGYVPRDGSGGGTAVGRGASPSRSPASASGGSGRSGSSSGGRKAKPRSNNDD